MTGQGFVLLAVGLFASLVVAAAAVDHYLLSEHPVSEVGGLLWRVENTLSRAKDVEISLASTEYGDIPQTVRMVVQVVISPTPALSVRYTEPQSMAGHVVTSDRDLLSHYVPEADLLIVRRWTGVPLAAVGLAGLDVSLLRARWQQGLVQARILDASASLASSTLAESVPLAETLAGTPLDDSLPLASDSTATFGPDLTGFAAPPSTGASDPLHGSYVIEVREAESGRLTETLWIDRTTYLIQKIVYFEVERRVRTLEVERWVTDQGLTADEVLALPRAATTIRG
jgi:hypothetical protein